jgi:hypothetical protein
VSVVRAIIPQNQDMPLFNEILVKFTYLVGMIADQNFYDIFFTFFYPTAEGENWAYGPTLVSEDCPHRVRIICEANCEMKWAFVVFGFLCR